ncbi:DUF1570 domain-containing protein [Microbulbifer sp. 2304DJ12-6]|uniref:DUF1570 domain-containing protein n=1 Tax=Microbulbifer sp. 2304DJ12-6 TaxID=3233340 RepID=UPI0039B04186
MKKQKNPKNFRSQWFIFFGVFFTLLLSSCTSSGKLINSEWHEITTQHFRVVTNGSPKEVKVLAEDLERFRLLALKYITFQPDQQRLTIYALADRLSFAGVSGNENSRVIGQFQNTSHGSVALLNLTGNRYLPDNPARQTLFHEYTHFLTYGRGSYNYPYWYSEGIAETFSTVSFSGGDGFEIGKIPVDRAISLNYLKALPLKRLLEATRGSLNNKDTEKLYASGWMLTHWMLFDPEREQALSQYIKAYQTDVDPVTALPAALGMTFDELDVHYRRLSKANFALLSGHLSELDTIVAISAKPMVREAAIAEVAHFMAITGQKPAVLQAFLAVAKQRGATSPPLQAALAISESQAGNFPRAREVLAAIPKENHQEIWYLEAHAEIALAQALAKEEELDLNAISNIRDEYVQLVNTQDEVSAYWHKLAITMQLLGYPRTQYLEMLEQAYLRAPRDRDIAWWFAHELYVSRNRDLLNVARPLLIQISNQESRMHLESMVREIEQEQEPITTSEPTAWQHGEMLANYHRVPGHKALALAIDYRGALAVGYMTQQPSQSEANDFALQNCEAQRKKYLVRDTCRIYAEGDLIVDSAPAAIQTTTK